MSTDFRFETRVEVAADSEKLILFRKSV